MTERFPPARRVALALALTATLLSGAGCSFARATRLANRMNGWEDRPVDRALFTRSAAPLGLLEADLAPDVLAAGHSEWSAAYEAGLARAPRGVQYRATRSLSARWIAWSLVAASLRSGGDGNVRERARGLLLAALHHFLEHNDLSPSSRALWGVEIFKAMELADVTADSYAFELFSQMALDWVRAADLWTWEIRLRVRRAQRAEAHGHVEDAARERLGALARAADFFERRSPLIETYMGMGASEAEARATIAERNQDEATQWSSGATLDGLADMLARVGDADAAPLRARVVTRLRALPLEPLSAASYALSLSVGGDVESATALAARCELAQAAHAQAAAAAAPDMEEIHRRNSSAWLTEALSACRLARAVLAARGEQGAVSRAGWSSLASVANERLRAELQQLRVTQELASTLIEGGDDSTAAQVAALERQLEGRDPTLNEALAAVRAGFALSMSVDELRAAALPIWVEGSRAGSQSGRFDLRPLIAHLDDPELAIALTALDVMNLERRRGALDVSDTARFFDSTQTKRAYEGLLAALAQRGAPGDAERALVVSELARARQFRELTGRGEVDAAAALTDPQARAATLRARIPASTVALSYKLVGESAVVLAATTGETRVIRLPMPAAALRELGRASNQALDQRSDDALDRLRTLGAALIDPLGTVIEGATSLVIVTDGELALVPFEALRVADGSFLLEHVTVGYLPSLELLEPSPRAHADAMLAFADPAYPTVPSGVPDGRTLSRAAGSQIPPLPETRDEVLGIARHFPGERSRILLGADARESALAQMPLRAFGYLHFATHGVLDGEYPGLYEPALILAAEGDEDSLLTAYEVEQLDLGARVTVLSACNTGTGRLYGGEGAMGMSRAFLVAGSESVVVSLWQVPSVETTELMIAFYEHLARGNEPAQALRLAKIDFLRTRGAAITTARRGMAVRELPTSRAGTPEAAPIGDARHHPHFWSAFIVIGGRVR